jgi:prophage regulatory protein
MVVLSFPELRERGIRFTRQHLHRLIRAGKFPAPIKIGEDTNAWVEPEIDQYMKERIAARDAIRQQTPEKKKARA